MIRVGIVGLGFIGMIHYLAYQKVRGAKVQAICEQDPVRRGGDWRSIKGNFGPPGEVMDLSGITTYAKFEQIIADPNIDVIDICLPTAGHAQVTIAALEAGKHVFCEKPLALTCEDAQRMLEAAKRANRQLLVGHVLPFLPEYRLAYDTITSKTYGELRGGYFKRIISDPLWLPKYYDPQVIGGPMLDLHVHDAHFIRLVCGMPRAVRTVGTMRGSVVERFSSQFLFKDSGMVVTAASGVIGQQGRPFTHGYEIYLEKATMLFDFASVDGQPILSMPVTILTQDGKAIKPEIKAGDPVDGFIAEINEVVDAVSKNRPSALLGGELARDAMLLCQRQTESVVRGQEVAV